MIATRRNISPLPFRSNFESGPDTRFPRAVAGEEFDRYARVVWRQAQRWTHKHWHRVTAPDLTMHDAREVLRSFAAIDLARRLYPQEEQLLSEVLYETWRERPRPDITPEIPAFLVSPSTPRPAA
jgi:hypothetical protein